jgi:hypothetical protein
MPNIYERLFTYRERADRSPLEDFLTEALADLLNRFPESVARGAVELFITDRSNALRHLARFWPNGAKATWATQRMIDGGKIIDLVMEVDGKPLLVIENKINAGFQIHQRKSDSEHDNAREHQLASYGRWLSRETPRDWGGALVLLSHWTPAPANFAICQQTYCSRYRNTVRWTDVSRWLTDAANRPGLEQMDWASLSVDLVNFLRKKDMDHERATRQDLAALQIYVASADRVRKSVEDIWESSKAVWRPICQQKDNPFEISTELGCAWKFRYLSRKDLRSSYLAFGIRFPDISKYLTDVARADAPYFFIELGSEDKASAISNLNLPSCWNVSDEVRIVTRPMHDFSANPDLLVSEAQAWVGERITEVAHALG